MEASSVTPRILSRADVRDWAWWHLPWNLRIYVASVALGGLAIAGVTASQTTWHIAQLLVYLLLLSCGLVSVAATPRSAYLQGGITRDFITVWVLPVAILLPPIYAMAVPVPLYLLTQWRVHKGVVYRKVFTAAAITLGYGAASLVFHMFPVSFAGSSIGMEIGRAHV